jgi:hypothetical protein
MENRADMPRDPFGDNSFLLGILYELVESGFELPVYCTMVGVNGSVSARSIEKLDGQVDLSSVRTVEHLVDGRFLVPINVFFVDSRGEAVRVLVQEDGKVELCN